MRATCDLGIDDLADVTARLRGMDAPHLLNAPNIVERFYYCKGQVYFSTRLKG